MNQFFKKMLVLFLTGSLVACASNTPRENQAMGATVGAAAGVVLGANSGPSPGPITMVATGAIVGALIGASYGNYMENSDKEKAFKALADGKPAAWQNPSTRVSFTITPMPNCVTFDGNPRCRQFTATQTTTDGARRKIVRTACLGSRGDWALVH